MSTDRTTGAVALGVAGALYWLASTADNPEAYLFPRMISLGIGALALAILVSGWRGADVAAAPARPVLPWAAVLPALAVFVAYRWAMEALGFYAATFLAFALVVCGYAPDPLSLRGTARRLAVSAAFVAVIYGLFSLLLRVQTPRGWLI